jgi:type IV secretory pathway VirB10-like protein
MSKMDNLRAMREAKYAAAQKRSADAPARPKAPVAPSAEAAKRTPAAQQPAPTAEDAPGTAEALCGHRNMSGRTCTREAGHAAKSHRYS